MKKALVVDDLRMHRTLIKGSLMILGFEVDLAEDGLQGMTKLKENPYDVIFSDIEMPNMNGFEFLARLRRDPRFSDLPVVMLSTLKDDTTIARMKRLGANCYLTKPYTIDGIRKALKTLNF